MMMSTTSAKTILVLSICLAVLIAIASYTGITTPGFYANETANWQVQSLGQDIADLWMITPVLLLSAVWVYRQNHYAALIWGGIMLYIMYTFVIYCFDVHFNQLFLLYCIILGITFYTLLYFLYSQIKQPVLTSLRSPAILKITGIYLIIIAVLFYVLWLSDIVPSLLSHTAPASLAEAGLPTNPVHVIDLAIFLPGLLITGILLLRKHLLGLLLAPMLLTFFMLMDITIGWLIISMKQNGLAGEMSVAVAMGVLAIFSLVLLVLFLFVSSSPVIAKNEVPLR
jgi:hypothetical protein